MDMQEFIIPAIGLSVLFLMPIAALWGIVQILKGRDERKRKEAPKKVEEVYSVKNYQRFTKSFLFAACFSVFSSLLHFYTFSKTGENISLSDGILGVVSCVMSLLLYQLLKTHNRLAIPLAILDMLGFIAYALLVGRGLHWMMFIIGFFYVNAFYQYWKRGMFDEDTRLLFGED